MTGRLGPVPGLERDEFAHRFIGTCMLVRLFAVLAALFGLLGQVVTLPVLLCTLLVSASSLSVLLSPTVSAFISRHPLACVADVLLSMGVVAVLGIESPLVLATLSTSLVVGFVFSALIAATCTVILVSGYYLVAFVNADLSVGFMAALGVPALYVGLVLLGGALRRAHAAQVEASLELVRARSAAAASDERARLAREMHDSVGKTLHGVALGADALPRLVRQDPQAAATYAQALSDGARQAAQEARELLVRMRADQLDRPIAEVIRELCEVWQSATGVVCRVAALGVVDLPTDSRYEVLAILGEALENVRRHARASRVDVNLVGLDGGAARLEIHDDGEGFVPTVDGRSPAGHFGITGMAERAREAGLQLQLRSAVGHGTTVTIERPTSSVETGVGEVVASA